MMDHRGGVVVHGAKVVSLDHLSLRAAEAYFGSGKVFLGGRTSHVGARTLDRLGTYLLPGFIDPHVHFDEPGRTEWEGIASGSLKAVLGGVTTVFDMPIDSDPPTISDHDVREKLQYFAEKSLVNYGVFAGAVPGRLGEMRGAAKCGIVGFKGFLSPSGWEDFPPLDEDSLVQAMIQSAAVGLPLALHVEDPRFFRHRGTSNERRPVSSEVNAVERVKDLVKEHGARVHLVHLSAPQSVDIAANDPHLSTETCPHYFMTERLSEVFGVPSPHTHPPVRPAPLRSRLRELVRENLVDVVASDHSPGPPHTQDSGASQWAGAEGVGRTVVALLDEFDSVRLVARYVRQCASVFGLSGRGTLQSGVVGDAVVVERLSPHRWRVVDVFVGGEPAVIDGEFVTQTRGVAVQGTPSPIISKL